MSIRQAQTIEVGLHQGRLGFTLTYTDGERAHILFHHTIARAVGEQLLKLANDLRYLEQQMAPTLTDRIGVGDSASVRISAPSNTLGIGTTESILTEDE